MWGKSNGLLVNEILKNLQIKNKINRFSTNKTRTKNVLLYINLC